MSLYRMCFVLLGLSASLCAESDWNHGAFFIPTLPEVGRVEGLHEASGMQSQQYVSGSIRIKGKSREDIFLLGSNGVCFYYTMPGELTIERFEQLGEVSGGGLKQSRMILHLTEGVLTVDSSAMSEDSQFVVETPLGRLNAAAGQWSLGVVYDARTRIYNLTLESIDLELTFKTHSGERFVVQAGDMLTGAGVWTLPDLEIADLLSTAKDRIQIMKDQSDKARVVVSLEQLTGKLQFLDRDSVGVSNGVQNYSAENEEAVRPIVIEYAPRPKPLVPFRGVMRRPREYRKDLF